MRLLDVVHRQVPPVPWAEGEKIPWNELGFSQRMLKEHLCQEHDAASRRLRTIGDHVDWIHRTVLHGKLTRVLDLGCGPGLYANRLADRGHECVGIDFSPASIDYAKQTATAGGLACTFMQEDIRRADYGSGYGLAMLIYGEFNVFRREDIRAILEKVHRSLEEDGLIVLEPHTWECVRRIGQQPASWYSSAGGLFSDRPHLYLMESFWDPKREVTTNRYLVLDAHSGEVTRYASSMQAYGDEEYAALLVDCGFRDVVFHESLGGPPGRAGGDLLGIVARRR